MEMSIETMMASIDKDKKMERMKSWAAQSQLRDTLVRLQGTGKLRGELKGITHSDYENLLIWLSELIIQPILEQSNVLLQVLQELQSMEHEFTPKISDSTVVNNSWHVSVPGNASIPILSFNFECECFNVSKLNRCTMHASSL
ncbi:hypothetical protein RIF29_18216 [Crotalaria pallida]|uniref:Uncharacterized protein n=1 Tax=Crotalaria pallida TaxID=3830 RepID=A0AAN9FIK3_CROPI